MIHRETAMAKGCDTKLRFYDMASATAAADSYNARIVIKFSNMVVYPCGRHRCLHIGHGNQRTRVKDAPNLTERSPSHAEGINRM